MAAFCFTTFSIAFPALVIVLFLPAVAHSHTCRSYCGNISVDYPFALQPGCGHPVFRDLLFCINDVLMLHITSGSYRVLRIDYAYQSLTLHDPHMSTCYSIFLGGRGNGFELEPWRAPYLSPTPDTVFMLIGCSAHSPLFQGKQVACRNVSGMGCADYYGCPAWDAVGRRRPTGMAYGWGNPPDCCALPFEAIKAVNLSRLQCEGYSSAYSLAPLRTVGAGEWSYGIRVKYAVRGGDGFCRACEATGGSCGYGGDGAPELCLCGTWNSTTNCDSVEDSSSNLRRTASMAGAGIWIFIMAWMTNIFQS